MRKLIRVTKKNHLSRQIKEVYPPLILSKNEVVYDDTGMIVAWLMKDLIREKMVSNLEHNASKCSLGHSSTNSRGKHRVAIFGSLIERGESGNIHFQDSSTPEGNRFLNENKPLIDYLCQIMSNITLMQSLLVDYVPKKHRIMKKFTVCFWNSSVIGMLILAY